MKLGRRTDRANGELAELAALADGSLPEERRAKLEERVAASPELAALLAEQQRAVELVRGAAAEVEAPARLRARVGARQRRPVRVQRRPLAFAGGVAAAAAALAIALLVTLPGGVGGPSVAEAAILATRPATGPAPGLEPGEPKLLARAVEGVAFPSWVEKFAWRASGVRADTIEERSTATVFYEKKGKRIGYTIVAGDALDVPKDAKRFVREGTELRAFTLNGRLVVTWLRQGHTCILSGAGVARDVLLKLAAWKGKGAVTF